MFSDAEVSAQPELSGHLRECDACRATAEQRRRVHVHWDRRALTSGELSKLRVGLSGKQQPKPRRAVVAIAACAVATLAVLAAAATYQARRSQVPSPSAPPAHEPAAVPALPTLSAEPNKTPVAPLPTTSSPVAREVARSTAPSAAVKQTPAGTDPRWTRVTDALRRNDTASAEQALGALTLSSDAGARDSARLTLAELWLHSGRSAQARPVLRELSQHGATPVVRARAATLLDQVGQ
jgi:hypothetical protein